MGHQLIARPLPAHRTGQTQNKLTQTSIPQVGFESTNPVLERGKTVHAVDGAVNVIGHGDRLLAKKELVNMPGDHELSQKSPL
jgi:late competence protein required for DNA uptake (superfamily II DNA/RNA helicase)